MSLETRSARANQAGFSLIELTVALVVTLIVSGAIFGLLVGGKSAFRREPELSDRQQQIRIAVAMIERDVELAGQDMGKWSQVFSQNLNDVGPQLTIMADIGPGIAGNSDFLEIRGNDGSCPSLRICQQGGAGNNIKTASNFPPCFNFPGLVVVTNRSTGASRTLWLCRPGPGAAASCSGGPGENGNGDFVPGGVAPSGCDPADPTANCNAGGGAWLGNNCDPPAADPDETPCDVSSIQIMRYEIRVDAQGVPDLWRSPSGGVATGASALCAPPAGAPASDWQLVARGIEDMQVQYRTGNTALGAWQNQPDLVLPPVPPTAPPTVAQWNNIVREVRLTLSARALAPNLQGQTTSVLGSAVRGRIQRTITPRMAMINLTDATGVAQWR